MTVWYSRILIQNLKIRKVFPRTFDRNALFFPVADIFFLTKPWQNASHSSFSQSATGLELFSSVLLFVITNLLKLILSAVCVFMSFIVCPYVFDPTHNLNREGSLILTLRAKINYKIHNRNILVCPDAFYKAK